MEDKGLWKVNCSNTQRTVVHMNMIDWWKIFPSVRDILKIRQNDTGVTALPQR
jgi:hypothetical protein